MFQGCFIMFRFLFIIVILAFSLQAYSFPCYITLVKDSCWTNYNVTVNILGPTNAPLATVTAPKGKVWDRVPFVCSPGESLSFNATFTPSFGEQEVGKIYPARHSWRLPVTIGKEDTAWNITLCYPTEFASVPLPPNVPGPCVCNKESITPIQPK